MFAQKIKLLIFLQNCTTGPICVFENKIGRPRKDSLKNSLVTLYWTSDALEQTSDSVLGHFSRKIIFRMEVSEASFRSTVRHSKNVYYKAILLFIQIILNCCLRRNPSSSPTFKFQKFISLLNKFQEIDLFNAIKFLLRIH